jgi:hypothetical protein
MSLRLKKIISAIALSIVFGATVLIAQFIAARPESKLHHHIPIDASIYFKVNNPNLLRRFFFDFLFEAELQKKDYQQLDYRRRIKNIPITGIDISKEVYVFYEAWSGESILGILFHLNDEKSFAEFVNKSESFIAAFNKEIAAIIIAPENILSIDEDKLVLYANDLLLPNPDRTPARIAFSEGNNKNLFQLYVKGDERSLIRNINLELFMDNNFIELKGMGERNPLRINTDSTSYTYISEINNEKNYLEINAGKLPDTVNKYLNKVLNEIGVNFPDITSQQLFIYALEIDNIRGTMALLPKFDGVFRFNDALPIIAEMDSLASKMLILEGERLKVGRMEYIVKQLNDYELFVGIHDVEFATKEESPTILIQGDPSVLLNIEGDGIIAQVAKLMPQVQHSRKLFSDMESFKIESKEYRSDSIQVNGMIAFPGDKTASIEIIKYLLKF